MSFNEIPFYKFNIRSDYAVYIFLLFYLALVAYVICATICNVIKHIRRIYELRLTKQEAVEKLKERGFNAFVEKGVVTVIVAPDEKGKFETYERISKELKEIGYNASWGVHAAHQTEEAET